MQYLPNVLAGMLVLLGVGNLFGTFLFNNRLTEARKVLPLQERVLLGARDIFFTLTCIVAGTAIKYVLS